MFRAFDPVVIRLSLDATNIQREKIVFELVKPFIPGFSVEPMEEDAASIEEQTLTKRKVDESVAIDDPSTVDTSTVECSVSKTKTKKNKKSKK